MSMASMVQNFFPNEYNFEGYNSSSAASFSSQFSFNGSAPPPLLLARNVGANAMWEEANKSSPPMQGPFTPVHLPSTAACTQQPDQDDHSPCMQDAIRLRNFNADLLSFNHNQIPASFEMDFPLAEDTSPLNDLLGLQRKLSMYSSYGDGDDLSQASMAAADDDQSESLMQACSYGVGVKLCNLTRSFTFPPTHAARAAIASSCGGAARSPLILGSDADMKHG
eukprot:c26176_g1_i1 orf=3-668(-)